MSKVTIHADAKFHSQMPFTNIGWSLYFAPDIVQAVVGCAAGIVAAPDPNEGLHEVGRVLRSLETNEPAQSVFPDAVGPDGEFRRSDAPPMAVQVLSGRILCPYCDISFMVPDPRRWDGEQHTTCGQRLLINNAASSET